MDANLTRAIATCRREVESDLKHQMGFGTRRGLLRALGPHALDVASASELAVGKRRRLLLALDASRRVAPIWSRDLGTRALADLLELLDRHIANAATVAEVRRRTDSLTGGLQNAPRGKDLAWLAGRAVEGTGWVAVSDELLVPDEGVSEEELANPEDPDHWDPAFFAAAAWAGGMPWTPAFSATAYREFWLWYLDDAVPRAWHATSP